MTGEIAILRKCWRCKQWESIDNYEDNAKLCQFCMRSNMSRRVGNCGSTARSIVITDSGRQILAQWRAEETPAA